MNKYNAPAMLNPVRSARSPRIAGALLAGLMVTLAPLASAGTIGISGGRLIVGTEPGDAEQAISVSISGTDLVILGVNFDLVTPGCTGQGTFLCALSGFNELVILGGSGDDVVDLSGISAPGFAITVLGGAGADVLIGSGGNDKMYGGSGDDVLIGGAGLNCLSGGPGNNIVLQGGCNAGPDPVIAPLTRTNVPEPGGLALLATGLVVLPFTRLRKQRGRGKS